MSKQGQVYPFLQDDEFRVRQGDGGDPVQVENLLLLEPDHGYIAKNRVYAVVDDQKLPSNVC